MFEGLSRYAILADYLNGLTFSGCTIETCLLGGVSVYNGGGGLSFEGCYFEENKNTGSAGTVKYFDIFIGSNSYLNGGSVHGCLFNGNNGVARTTDDYVPIRIKFARGWSFEGNQLNTGTNFCAFEDDAIIENTSFGKLGLHIEQGAAFDAGTGLTAIYHNLPVKHAFLSNGLSIEGISRINGTLNSRFYRELELTTTAASYSSAVTGTGAFVADSRGAYAETGATASSTARGTIGSMGLSQGLGQASVSYADSIEITGEFLVSNISAGTSSGACWLMLTTASVAANPSTRSVGFKVVHNALWGLVHDGTTLNLVDLSTSLSAGVATQLKFIKAGPSTLWYVNGILKGSTTTNVPSGNATALHCLSASNGANSANQRLGVYDAKYIVTQ